MGNEMQERGETVKTTQDKKHSYRAILALLESQDYLCALSGVRLDVETAELDHKIPVARGGTNDLSNLQWIHKKINRAKGTLTNEEFISVCEMVVSKRAIDTPQSSRYFPE